MQKKSILIVSAVFPPEPVVSAALSRDIAEELSNSNDVIVFCPKPTRPMGFEFPQDHSELELMYNITYANSYTCPQSNLFGRIRENFSFGFCCAKYIEENHQQIKLIYANVWPLISQFLIVKAANKYKIPIIAHVQDVYPESYSNKLPWVIKKMVNLLVIPLDKYILANSSSILVISNKMQKLLSISRNIPIERFFIVPNWQNEKDFLSYHENAKSELQFSDAFTFMYLGNIGPLAGVDFLIECFIQANIPNSKLIIAGAGSKKAYCENIVKSQKISNIIFLAVPEGKVPEIQGKADVMLLSLKKGGGITSIPSKLPAYMFSAKPIICSIDLESDTANTVIQAQCGLVVEPESKELLIKAMRTIASTNREKLEIMGQSGFDYSMKTFSKKENLKKIITLFNEIATI